MSVLSALAVVGCVVVLISVLSTVLSGHVSSVSPSKRLVLLFGGPLDGLLVTLFFQALGLSWLTSVVGGILLGVASCVYLQPLLLPQRLLVWRLAKENILRRRRQAALLLAGLVITSAIITSSLVIGDSLDETVEREVQASWGATDVLIAGIDPFTGAGAVMNQSLGERLWTALTGDAELRQDLLGRQYSVATTVSLQATSGLAESSIPFFARDAGVDAASVWAPLDVVSGLRFKELALLNNASQDRFVVLNEVAAEQLETSVGDELILGVFVTNEDERVRTEATVVVHAIVSNEGQGAMAGSRSPAVFTDLATAQDLLHMNGQLHRIEVAFDDDLTDETVRAHQGRINEHLNATLGAEDAGLVLTVNEDSDALTLTSERGLQRLAGETVAALRANQSLLYPNANLLEILQVPLADVEWNGSSMLTLADSDLSQLVLGERTLWHVASTGFGFERLDLGEAWLWQVDDGETVNDVAWDAGGGRALAATSNGLILADETALDDEYAAAYSSDRSMEAVARSSTGWVALESGEDGLTLLTMDYGLEDVRVQPLDLDPMGTVLSYRLQVGTEILLNIEGLLSSTVYASPLEEVRFVEVEPSVWQDQPVQRPTAWPAWCDGGAFALGEDLTWCTSSEGVVAYEPLSQTVLGLRLPVLSDAPGFGRFPQMFLAFGGPSSPALVQQGEVLTSLRLDVLALNTSIHPLNVTGLLPYAYGNDSHLGLTPNGTYAAIDGFATLRDLDAVVLGLVNLSDAETLALASEDERSMLIFSPSPDDSIGTMRTWLGEHIGSEDIHVRVLAVQLDAAEQAAESSGVLSAMFLVFGTFTMAAGVLLSLTIIVLLADVRRKELATVRALGMRRSDARSLFVMEGFLLALCAGGVGTLLGVVLAWVISVGFSSIFASVGAQTFSFAWSLEAVVAGWVWGSLVSFVLLSTAGAYNAQLNLVRALRGGRAPVSASIPWGIYLVQVVAFGTVVVCAAGFLLLGIDSGLASAMYVLGGTGLLAFLCPLLLWQLPTLVASNPREHPWVRQAPRNTLGAVGLLFLLWTVLLAPVDPVRQQLEPNELLFIVLGLLQVLAGVLVLATVGPLLVQRIAKTSFLPRRLGSVSVVSLAHPLAHPVRTAVVMGMFSITMFSVVVLGGYTAQFDTYSSGFVEDAEGEFELLLTSSRSRPIELTTNPDDWGLVDPALNNIDAVGAVARAPVHLENDEGERMPYILRGVDSGFIEHGGLPLYTWDESLGATSEEAWFSIGKFNDIVFLDASFGLEAATDGSGLVPLQFSIGDSILLIDLSNPKNTRSVQVGGFLEQSSYLFSPGVWMNGSVVTEQFGGEVTRMYVSVASDASPVNSSFSTLPVATQGKDESARRAALELEAVLDRGLSAQNVNVQTVSEEIMVVQALVLAILSLFQGYLALGLMVGVAGIGVVTVRNVSERRRTVGMLRALGFRQSDIGRLFALEVSWVALLGMFNGLVIGYGFHVALFDALWAEQGAVFAFPWFSTIAVFLSAWAVVLVTTWWPVRRASSIPPSAALRHHSTA